MVTIFKENKNIKRPKRRLPQLLSIKESTYNAGDARDTGSIPGWGRSPGGGSVNPLQYSCLENPRDRGALQTTVHGTTKRVKTWLDDWASKQRLRNVRKTFTAKQKTHCSMRSRFPGMRSRGGEVRSVERVWAGFPHIKKAKSLSAADRAGLSGSLLGWPVGARSGQGCGASLCHSGTQLATAAHGCVHVEIYLQWQDGQAEVY